FEDLAVMILGANGYMIKKHFRFRFNGKGYEVDVLALKMPWSLAVECKRWKRSLQPAARKRMAEIHQEKISSLKKVLPSLFNRFGLNIFHDVKLIPTVLTLFEAPIVIEHGIPFVPIRRFQSFIEQFEGYVGDFETNNPS
ncbi:restriction endonuclease, partial [Candidatus Bathyarchaeota archaeon]|nr:restriction endonuclease [Candidatus Bathyarchaeota archaeon]